jgi:hypothetical protein
MEPNEAQRSEWLHGGAILAARQEDVVPVVVA